MMTLSTMFGGYYKKLRRINENEDAGLPIIDLKDYTSEQQKRRFANALQAELNLLLPSIDLEYLLFYLANSNIKKAKVRAIIKELLESGEFPELEGLLERLDFNYSSDQQEGFLDYAKVSPMDAKSKPFSKAMENSLFAFNKQLDKDYFPTTEPIYSTGEFGQLSRKELLECYDAKNFFNLSNEQICALLQATASNYCLANNVSPCAVEFADLKTNDDMVNFGQYCPSQGKILLNKNFLDQLSLARETNNQAFIYQLLDTVIHESHHRTQFANMEMSNNPKQSLINNSLTHPQGGLSYEEYLSEPDEIDARDSALRFFRQAIDLCPESQADGLKRFYMHQKMREQKNGKAPVSSSVESFFPDVYNPSYAYNISNREQQLAEAQYSDLFKQLNGHRTPERTL